MRDASLLEDVIVGGSIEELDLNKTTKLVQAEIESLKSEGLDEDDTLLRVTEILQKRNVKVKQLTLGSLRDDQDNTAVNILVGANNLEEAITQLKEIYSSTDNTNKKGNDIGKFGMEEKVISMKQVARIWNRLNVGK